MFYFYIYQLKFKFVFNIIIYYILGNFIILTFYKGSQFILYS